MVRAVEYNDKRFVVLRDPHGKTNWKGRWSDGSKEWTDEWLLARRALGHTFGNDGQFVMECSCRWQCGYLTHADLDDDFVEIFTSIERCRLFDASWRLSSVWLRVSLSVPSDLYHADIHRRCRDLLYTSQQWGDVSCIPMFIILPTL